MHKRCCSKFPFLPLHSFNTSHAILLVSSPQHSIIQQTWQWKLLIEFYELIYHGKPVFKYNNVCMCIFIYFFNDGLHPWLRLMKLVYSAVSLMNILQLLTVIKWIIRCVMYNITALLIITWWPETNVNIFTSLMTIFMVGCFQDCGEMKRTKG